MQFFSRVVLLLLAATLLALSGGVQAQPATGDPARLERIRKTPMPKITKPVMFDTPEADAILSALEVFPPDNPVEPRGRELAAASQLAEDRRLDRPGQAVALQPRHGLHPRAAGPEESRREDW